MKDLPRVAIVLATYNGASYVLEQIESIRAQTWAEWTLLIRDDGSTDATRQLLEEAARQDARIEIMTDSRGTLGPVGNFGALLKAAQELQADYVFLSDQDDVWKPDKLSRQMACMRAIEATHGEDIAVLIHSDLSVVDAGLNIINRSFMSYAHFRHDEKEPIKTLLAQNFVTGCTVGVNGVLLRAALPMPREALMHDWWLALIAATYGRIAYLPEPTVLYRQHAHNQVGAKSRWAKFLAKFRIWWHRDQATAGIGIKGELRQAEVLFERTSQVPLGVSDDVLALIRSYVAVLRGTSAVERVRLLFASGVRPQTWVRTADFYRRLVYGLS